ncbi:hypothetical protein [Tunturiibacter gelidiferens]|uniref:hypothetical protein n=1 Tax=Tunturiibacter gelidiferens TaxID=3069689 RepID=UPI003D9BE21C
MLRRRRSEPELTWEQFLAFRRQTSLHQRINEERVDFSQIFYKAAVGHFAGRRYIHTVGNATLAVLLRPRYILSEMITKSKWRMKSLKNKRK